MLSGIGRGVQEITSGAELPEPLHQYRGLPDTVLHTDVLFPCSKKIAGYLGLNPSKGLNPSEDSSGGKRRIGAICKQGNTRVRWLLTKTVHPAARQDPELRQGYHPVSSPYYSFTLLRRVSQPITLDSIQAHARPYADFCARHSPDERNP